MPKPIELPSATLQIGLASELEKFRKTVLQQALAAAVGQSDLRTINAELDEFAPVSDLVTLATRGIRGELLFPIPVLLRTAPRLFGYYRLLLGFSQKDLYTKGHLPGAFRVMEDEGRLTVNAEARLIEICRVFAKRASELLNGIGIENITATLLHELTLLTVGPQLRGGLNNQIGQLATQQVFNLIRRLVIRLSLPAIRDWS